MLLLTSLVAGLSIHAQVTIVKVDSKMAHYGICNVLYYKAPLTVTDPKTIVFVPGKGQHKSSSDPANTNGLLNLEGPLTFIQNYDWRPDFNVIVVQPSVADDDFMFTDGNFNPVAEQRYFDFLKNMLDYMINPVSHPDFPKVNKNKIYLTGLSLGAHYIHSYVKKLNSGAIKPQAMVTMSVAMPSGLNEYVNFQNIPAWGFIGSKDINAVSPEDSRYMPNSSFFSTMSGFWMLMKDAGWPGKRLTIYEGSHGRTTGLDGQNGWQFFYNPLNKFPEVTALPYFKLGQTVSNEQPSIYDWMLQYNNTATPLPVTFHSFKAQYITTETILQWSTASETNNAYFVIERSEDGINFKEVGRVASKAPDGNSTSLLSYIYKLFSK